MQFEGSVITEQGVTFAIVIVKRHVLQSASSREDTRDGFKPYFRDMPVILMAQDSRGTPTYHGRNDIVKFLANIHVSQIPWKRYTV